MTTDNTNLSKASSGAGNGPAEDDERAPIVASATLESEVGEAAIAAGSPTFPTGTTADSISLQQLDRGTKGHDKLDPSVNSNLQEDTPMQEASIFSRMWFNWLTPVMTTGYHHPLEESDLFSIGREYSAQVTHETFAKQFHLAVDNWKQINPDAAANKCEVPLRVTMLAMWRSFGRLWAFAGAAKLFGDCCSIALTVCIERVIALLSSCQAPPNPDGSLQFCNLGYGLMLVVLMLLFQISGSLATHTFWHFSMLTGLRVRTAIITAGFNKSLQLSNAARAGEWNTGKVVNVISTDTNRLDIVMPYLHQLWTCPLQVTIAMALMINYVGWPALVGFGFLICFVPLQSRAMAPSQSFDASPARGRDQLVTKVAVWRSVVVGVAIAAPALAAVAVFSTYAAIKPLVPSLIFGSLSLLNMARMPLWMIPQSYAYVLDAKVSLRRVTNLLMAEEAASLPTVLRTNDPNHPAIQVSDASFAWESSSALQQEGKPKSAPATVGGETESMVPLPLDEPKIYIADLNLTIRKGELVAVVGKVGSGKSSLLSALVGEMERVSGSVVLDGGVAYCPQVPWIQCTTLKENVLFGRPLDEQRYNEAIYLSALQRDIERLPGGDMVEIGERGINLSGGQKARCNLARAVYANCEINLFDDILAAVDAHVAAFLFHNCIKGHLARTTRVLVTHSLSYAAQCDRILVMNDGKIVDQGTLSELMSRSGPGAALFAEYAEGKEGTKEDAGEDDVIEQVAGTRKPPGGAEQERRDPANAGGAGGKTALMAAEERERGAVKSEHYKRYVLYSGGWVVVSWLLFGIALTQAVRVVNDLWLAWWADDLFKLTTSQYIWIFVGLGLVQTVITIVSNVVFVYSGVQASRRMHYSALRRLMYAPLAWYDQTPLGRVLSRLSKDVDLTDNLLYDSFRMFLRSFSVLLSVMIIMIAATPWVSLVIAILIALYYIVQKFYRATNREAKRLESLTRSPMYALFGEVLTGMTTIRAYGEQDRFRQVNFTQADRNARPYFLQFSAARWLGVRLESLGSTVTASCALFAVLFRYTISPSLIGLTLSYGLQITMLLNNNVFQGAEAESQMNAVERLDHYAMQLPQERGTPGDLADAQAGTQPKREIQPVPEDWPSRGEIELRDVHMAYSNGIPVLRGITATIPPGARVAVVGRTGAGKSSMLAALLRLTEPNGGEILIDGINVQNVSLYDLRSRMAVIPQEPVLFNSTIRGNLDKFNQFTDQEIWTVLDRVGLGTMVRELELKLDAPVSENGENFSLGERSCLCLCRAMLGHKRILVMDEASASIDLATEAVITESIRRDFDGITILTVAHRLHTVIDYDYIMVLEHGKVAEFDSPSNLLRQPESIFKSLVDETGPASLGLLHRLAFASEERRVASKRATEPSLVQ
ncbi:P-loop containing nucleoside triphosphate hydrolase protein [Catenaria anguillulae PL171]|uniref:p-loop containing nucleoside triphosphate hydrolase protein n=1 Tax=Catenaria anguillulae PL171 TaxID=765915 RepID=A0A1Y2HKT0_9FUNG|nr:P-loop containing nucleoside triphosphate hydrolase protein [Catenaria anguillulae PL171]